MSTEDDLMAAVVDEPDADEPRFVYADWLEEQGDKDRADFIRLDCEHATLPIWDERREAVHQQIETLWDANKKRWTKGLQGTKIRDYQFHRGFLDHVVLNGTSSLQHTPQVFANFPTVQSLKVNKVAKVFDEFLNADWLPKVRRLSLGNNGLGIKRIEQLAQCASLQNLEQLNVRSNKCGNKGITALFGSTTLSSLKEIDIGHTDLTGREEAIWCFDGDLSKQLHRISMNAVRCDLDSIDFAGRLFNEVRFPKLSYLDISNLDWGEDPIRDIDTRLALSILDAPEVLNLQHLLLPIVPNEFLIELPKRSFRRLLSLSLEGDFNTLANWQPHDPVWANLEYLAFCERTDDLARGRKIDPVIFQGLKCFSWWLVADQDNQFVADLEARGVKSLSEFEGFELLGRARDHIFGSAAMVCDD